MSTPLSGDAARVLGLHSDVEPEEFALEGDVCTIGRSPLCDITVARGTVSRLHAKIERKDPRYILYDADSVNGTFVNERRVRGSHVLKDRDCIGLGGPVTMLRFVDPDPTVIPAHRLRYDESNMEFYLGQRPLALSPSELRLLRYLYQHAGDVCTRESCAEAVWGRDYDPELDAAPLDRVVSNLRRKLSAIASAADLIHTRRGLGYVLVLE